MHTPGPWTWDKRESAGGAPVIVSDKRGIATVWFHNGSDDPEVHDNAHLIAAAPDLYEAAIALERAEEYHANCHECEGLDLPEKCELCFPKFDDARLKRRAALARAEGRS